MTEVKLDFIGQAESPEAATCCTVFIAPQGMHARLDVRGGGSCQESQLLNPLVARSRYFETRSHVNVICIINGLNAMTAWFAITSLCARIRPVAKLMVVVLFVGHALLGKGRS